MVRKLAGLVAWLLASCAIAPPPLRAARVQPLLVARGAHFLAPAERAALGRGCGLS